MSLAMAHFAEKLVSISEFSQGKAGKIFGDVAENNNEYIVLKNNQPTAVIVSVKEYREIQEKVAVLEELKKQFETIRMLKRTENVIDGNNDSTFEELVAENRLTEEELAALAQCIGELE